jgi:hypothetical protein
VNTCFWQKIASSLFFRSASGRRFFSDYLQIKSKTIRINEARLRLSDKRELLALIFDDSPYSRLKTMITQTRSLWFFVFSVCVTVVAAVNVTFAQSPDAKAESVTEQPDASQLGSLMRVPDSTGLYFSTMNHQAVVDSIFESNAYKSIKASEVSRGMKKAYRRGRTRGYADYNEQNPFAQYLQGYGESIDNVVFQSVWQIARQVIDNELFLYVDNDALPVINRIQTAQAELLEKFNLDEAFDVDDLTEEQMTEMINLITDTIESIECPTVILGSRLENPQGFRGMLELARSAAEQGMRNLPDELEIVQEFWKVVEEEDNFLLTAQIDMSKLPWNELLKEADAEQMEMALAVRDAVAEKQATVAMGIVNNLLVFGFAKDPNRLTEFGNGAKLIDLDSLKPLRAAIDQNQRLVSVFYMSEEYARASYSLERLFQQLKPMIRPIIKEIDEIPDDDQEQLATMIENEANEFVSDFQEFFPARSMMLSFTSLQSDGLHGYSRSPAKHPMLDGSKPLNLNRHAGADTIAFLSQRLYRLSDQYDLLSKWTSKLYRYGRDFALTELEKEMAGSEVRSDAESEVERVAETLQSSESPTEDELLEEFNKDLNKVEPGLNNSDLKSTADTEAQQDQNRSRGRRDDDDAEPDFETIKSFVSDVEALFKRFDDVTRNKLLPAIDGQEAGLFIDAVSGPNPWHPDMPVAQTPLPLPSPAFVVGTNDSQAIIDAGEVYWQLADDLLSSARRHFPEEDVKDAFLLPPNRIEKNGDVSFRWTFLHDFGQLDSSIQPGSLVDDNWLVLNLYPDQAKQLTMPGTDRQMFGPADTDEASVSIGFYDHRVAMKSLRTWIDFAETQIPKDEKPFDLAERYPAKRDTLQFTEPQLRDAFERVWAFADCFKGISIRTYHDTDGSVSESLLKFEDVAAE